MWTYHDIAASVAIKVNALVGTDSVELQVTYSTRPLTDELFDSSIFPFNAIRDAILQAEGKLCQAIGKSADRVLRSYIGSQTVALASGSELPTLDANGEPIIGNFGAVVDAADPNLPCTQMPVAVIRRRLQSSGLYLIAGAQYALDGTRIIHTQDETVLECCVYNATTQQGAFDANEPILLSDTLAEAYINGALALLVRDDEFTVQATQFAQYFAVTLGSIPPAIMEAQPA